MENNIVRSPEHELATSSLSLASLASAFDKEWPEELHPLKAFADEISKETDGIEYDHAQAVFRTNNALAEHELFEKVHWSFIEIWREEDIAMNDLVHREVHHVDPYVLLRTVHDVRNRGRIAIGTLIDATESERAILDSFRGKIVQPLQTFIDCHAAALAEKIRYAYERHRLTSFRIGHDYHAPTFHLELPSHRLDIQTGGAATVWIRSTSEKTVDVQGIHVHRDTMDYSRMTFRAEDAGKTVDLGSINPALAGTVLSVEANDPQAIFDADGYLLAENIVTPRLHIQSPHLPTLNRREMNRMRIKGEW